MEMPKPSDAHRQLKRLAGDWIGQETIAPNPWDPGGTATGRVRNRVAVEGFLVVQDYEQERNGKISFSGHGVFSYDANHDAYLLHWWDSMGMSPNFFKGTFNGDRLTLTCDDHPMKSRATFNLSDNKYGFLMEMSQDGVNWTTFMEGNYDRQGAS